MSEAQHTQRVVSDDFEEFLCSPCKDFRETNLCDIELNPSIHPIIQDTQEKTRKGERPKNSIGNSSLSATAANSENSGNSGNSVSVATAEAASIPLGRTRSAQQDPVMQDTRVVKEPTDTGKFENTFMPEILEAAKKKCCAWFGVPNMFFWMIEQTSLGIMGWAFSEALIASTEAEVERSESADWDSESELSELDPWSAIDDSENEEETSALLASASDDEPVDDAQYAEVMESWDVWNGPCMCGSKTT